MDNLNGIYTGIVIDNTGKPRTGGDSRFIGQVLVKINGITPSRINEKYKAVPSSNVDGALDMDMAMKSEVLAYVMAPITGESSQGIYNASKNETSATRSVASKQFTLMHKKLRDSHCDGPKKHLTPINNPYGNNYFPNYPWNTGLGTYGIPEVNSRVIIGFLKGYRSFPIVLGKLNTPDEQESFYNRGRVYGSAPGSEQNYTISGKPGTGPGTTGTTKDATANTETSNPYLISQQELDSMTADVYVTSPTLKYSDGTPVKYSKKDPAGIKNDPDIMPITKFLFGP